jgi:predicted flap endonuclease-1-like 5' DNA nuclease
MRFLSLLPYLLILPALAAGFGVGWLLRSHLIPEQRPSASPDSPDDLADLQKRIQETETNLAESEAQLTHLNKNLAAARICLVEREEDHRQLLNQLRERRTDMNEAAAELNHLEEKLKAKRDRIEQTLTDIDRLTGELDMLKELEANYQSDIDRLAQHVQWQDGELGRLRQTINQRSSDVTDAETRLSQREAELEHLIRKRQQREGDIHTTAEPRRHIKHESENPQQGTLPIPVDDLTRLSGLTDTHARLLREAGIVRFAQIAQARPLELETILGISDGPLPDVRRWIAEARRLISGSRESRNPPVLPPPTP